MSNQKRILIGFSLALMVALTVGCSFALALIDVLRPHAQMAVMSLAFVGIFLLVLGRCLVGTFSQTRSRTGASSVSREEHPLFFFKRMDYWGWILVLSALPIFFLSQRLGRPMLVEAKTRPQPTLVIKDSKAEAPAEPVVIKFPDLKLAGLVCNGSRSTAVVNGMTVGLGQKVDGVRVVAIERWGITVELDGRERHVSLPQ